MTGNISSGWRWRLRWLGGFVSGERAAVGPYAAVVDVTTRCNLRCFACPRHAPGAAALPSLDFPWAEFQRLCPQLGALGVVKLVLIGEGEPLLHPRLADMIGLAKRTGLHVTLVSNGTLLDAEAGEALLAAGLDELRVSLWASTPEEYAHNCTGNDPRFFARVIDGLAQLRRRRDAAGRARPRLTLHRPIERHGFRGLPAMVELALAAGCDAVSFSPLKPLAGLGGGRDLDEAAQRELGPILLRLDESARARGLVTNVRATLERYRIGADVWRALPCYMGWLDLRIRGNGDVMACGTCRTRLGNVFTTSIAEVWNGAEFRRFRAATRCRSDFEQAGLACDCSFCCHALTNARLHRVLGWLPHAPSAGAEARA